MAFFSLGIHLHKKFSYWTLINSQREILWQGKVVTDREPTEKALTALPVPANECKAVIEPVAQWSGTQSFLRHPVRENDRSRKARRKSPRATLPTATPIARSIFAGTGEIDRKSTVVK